MSRRHPMDLPNTPIEIIGGRQPAPYSKAPIWLIFAVSPMARALYDILAAHLNQERGDSHVWPTRETLAELMGVKQPRSVDKYLNELEAAGAIDVIHRKTASGMKDRNVYVIHHDPPDGYTGPRSMPEYYRAQRDVSAGGGVVRSSAQRAEQVKHAEPPNENPDIPTHKHVSAGQPVVRSSAQRSAFQRTYVVRSSAPELEEEELEEEPSPLPPEHHAPRQSHPGRHHEGEGEDRSSISKPDTTGSTGGTPDLVDAVREIRPEWSPTSIRRTLAAPDVACRPADITRVALLIVAKDPATQSPGRLAADGPWWAQAAAECRPAEPEQRELPTHCGDSRHDFTTLDDRRLYTDSGACLGPCPKCHPSALGAAQ